jgi:enoyl-CoA hydratase/carnithine racemase
MLRVEHQGSVTRITLNRPEVRNAFNDELIEALTSAFQGLPAGTRAVVLSGEGKSFSAGGDLSWMKRAATYTEEENYQDALKLSGLFQAIVDCPAVVIAKVQGHAFGGGCGLVAASDVAVVVEGTKFAFSEVKLGLIPATISTFVMPKIGAGHARALFTTGIAFDAERALRIGLVHDVCAENEADSVVKSYVDAVLSSGPIAVASAKKTAVEGPYSQEVAARMLAEIRAGEEGKEGVRAFLEKRPASFVEKR